MSELIVLPTQIPEMPQQAIDNVRQLEDMSIKNCPQHDMPTLHVMHAGMYARTVLIPAGVMLTGALIKIATLVITSGDIVVYVGEQTMELVGYHVVPASHGRKQAFVARGDTYVTMIFPTDAETIPDAEEQFTDEADKLMSRRDDSMNHVIMTGER